EFLGLAQCPYAALQQIRGLLQQFSLPLPPDQTALVRAEIILREYHQGCDHLLDSVAPARRNRAIGTAPSLLQSRGRLPCCINSPTCPLRSNHVEIDLVAYHPQRRSGSLHVHSVLCLDQP